MPQYTKYTAQGNDYIVIDPLLLPFVLGPDAAEKICDRQNGLGADGILYGPFRDDSGIDLKIFNANGTECGRSGNGLSIFAHYLYRQGYVSDDQLSIKTSAGQTKVSKVDLDKGIFAVDAGPYIYEKREISVDTLDPAVLANICAEKGASLEIDYISNGNPHCVVFVDEVSQDQTIQLGHYINENNLFPEGVNVQTVEIIDRHSVKAQVFERGAGYTLSSAASACAISAVTHTLGLTEPVVDVLMPGGQFRAQISDEGHVLLTLNVTSICDGDFSASYLNGLETM